MITVTPDSIAIKDMVDVKPELFDYLETYVKQYNQMQETYAWFKDKITTAQKMEWERTIKSISTVCQALNAGFEPFVPNANWASGQLFQYIAPIPEHVRTKIDIAIPIFGEQQILIYDPNIEHFRRPRNYDPVAVGFVTLANQRLQFCIGCWDIDKDLKFIDAPKGGHRKIRQASQNLTEVVRMIAPPTITIPLISLPLTTTWDTGTGILSQPYNSSGQYPAFSSKWVSYMTTANSASSVSAGVASS